MKIKARSTFRTQGHCLLRGFFPQRRAIRVRIRRQKRHHMDGTARRHSQIQVRLGLGLATSIPTFSSLCFSHNDSLQCLSFNPVTCLLISCAATDFGICHTAIPYQ